MTLELLKQGVSTSEIAKRVGRSTSFVYNCMEKFGMTAWQQRKDRKEFIRQYLIDHPQARIQDVAQAAGISVGLAYKNLASMGITLARHVDIEKLRELLEIRPSMTIRDLAEFFGCSVSAIHAAKKRMNNPTKRKPRGKLNSVTWENIAEVLVEKPGISASAVAAILGANVTVVLELYREHGLFIGQKIKIDTVELARAVERDPFITYNELASKFGCSRQAVADTCQRMGLAAKRRAAVKERKDNIIAALKKIPVLSFSEIAEQNGVSSAVVYRLASSYVPSRMRPKKVIDYAAIVEYARKNPGKGISEISDVFECSETMVAKALEKNGLHVPDSCHQVIDDAKLEKLLQENPKISRAELAEIFGCSMAAISKAKSRIQNKRVPKKPHSARFVSWEVIKKMRLGNPDDTIEQLAKKIGISTAMVYRALRRHGMLNGHKRKIDREEVWKEFENGAFIPNLAKKLGVSTQALYGLRRIFRQERAKS